MSSEKTLTQKIRGALRLGRAIRLVWHCAPGLTLASYVLTFIQGVLPLAALYLMKLVVDAVAAGLAAPDKVAAFQHAAFLIACAGAVALAGVLLGSLAAFVGEAQGQVVTDYVADVLHAKSVEVDLEFYENPKYYDALHRAQQEATFRPQRIVNGLAQLGQSVASLVAMAGLLLSLHPLVAAVLFVAAVPGVLVRLRFSGRMYAWQRGRTPTERKAWYYHWILTDGGHAKEVRLFDLGALFRGRFSDVRRTLRRERLSLTKRRSLADLATQGGGAVIVFGTYAFIAFRAIRRMITLGDLVMYFQAFQRGLGALQGLLGGLAGLYEDNLFLSNFTEFMDLAPRVVDPPHPRPLPVRMREGIAFRGVSFQYPTGDRRVLDDVTLHVAPGEVVALVGSNGAGKTTLIKLLCRLYDPTAGTLAIDGTDLREFAIKDLRRAISVIFQDYARYSLSARENIWLGNTELSAADAHVEAAARLAGASEVIARLPRGYDSVLGHWFEDGQELSVGEWQKVALARAFLRDAQVIVLDEPTSAMDAMAEHEVFQAFRRMLEGRTAILISHRFSTVKLADRIFVLDGGRLVESGSHDELIRLGGQYAEMFETQAESYR